MTLALVFGDVERVVSEWIRSTGVRVYSRIPAKPVYPLVVVQRLGGRPAVKQYLDAPYVQVEVWGDGKSQVLDLAEMVRERCLAIEGQIIGGMFTTGVSDALGLTWLPDETGRDRYVFAVTVFNHPL